MKKLGTYIRIEKINVQLIQSLRTYPKQLWKQLHSRRCTFKRLELVDVGDDRRHE
jgi:hypothetical protein